MSENQQLAVYKESNFEAIKPRMIEAGFTPEKVKQELSFALQHINKSVMLRKCTGESILQAVMNISNIGLSLNPAAKESYLIPRWNSNLKQYEAALEPSYIGLVKLLTDAGSVTSMTAQLVYSGDQFTLEISDNRNPVIHRPCLKKSDRGELMGGYALATLPDGTRQAEWMEIGEINDIRGRSEAYKAFLDKKMSACTWTTDPGEMTRKTVIKRIFKYLPRTDRMQHIDEAVKADNEDYLATDDQISFIESLIQTSTLDQMQRDDLEMESASMSRDRASEVIRMLKENQQDAILHRGNASQAEIGQRVRQMQ